MHFLCQQSKINPQCKACFLHAPRFIFQVVVQCLSVGAPSRQQDSSGVRCCCDFCSSVVSQAFKKWYLYLAYFYLRELAEHTSLPPSSGGLEVKPLGIVHFAHVPLGYRSDYKSLNAASADLLALQKVQKIFTLLLKFPTKFFSCV